MPFPDATEGLFGLLRAWLGYSPHTDDDEALRAVDSIDLIIVGLGLLVVLLVLLRR